MILQLRNMLDSTVLMHLVCCKQSQRNKLQGIANSATKKEEKVADAEKNWEPTIGMTPPMLLLLFLLTEISPWVHISSSRKDA